MKFSIHDIHFKGLPVLLVAIFVAMHGVSYGSTYSIGINGTYGHLWKHTSVIEPFEGTRPAGGEIFINRHTYGEQQWQSAFNYPDPGFSIQFLDLQDERLGYTVSGISYMDLYLYRGVAQHLSFRFGTGLSYFANPYDASENPENEAIGSHINMNMHGRLTHHIALSNRWKLLHSLAITHISNGDLQLPNRGVNIPHYQLGFEYSIQNREEKNYKSHESRDPERRYFGVVTFAGTINEKYPPGGKKYPAYTLSLEMQRKNSYFSKVVAGLDGFHNEALESHINSEYEPDERPSFRQAGIFAGHELRAGNIALMKHFGGYFYKPYDNGYDVYQRYGVRYYVGNHFLARVALKVHWGRADVFNIGAGLRF